MSAFTSLAASAKQLNAADKRTRGVLPMDSMDWAGFYRRHQRMTQTISVCRSIWSYGSGASSEDTIEGGIWYHGNWAGDDHRRCTIEYIESLLGDVIYDTTLSEDRRRAMMEGVIERARADRKAFQAEMDEIKAGEAA